MGQETEIAWTGTPRPDGTIAPGATFNGWIGCAKISEGCKNCYAAVDTFARRSRHNGLELWGVNAARHRTSADYWKQPIRWNKQAAAEGVRRRVFCMSLADTFEDRRDLDPWRADLFSLIEATPWLDWLLLTKRPENMIRLAPERWAGGWPANVWAGCTVENQEQAYERITPLIQVPAAVRFLSVEPMLEEIGLEIALSVTYCAPECAADPNGHPEQPGRVGCSRCGGERAIHWVIVGGESGSGARPFDLAWAESIAEQCTEAGVPYFFKQAGSNAVYHTDRLHLDGKGGDIGQLTAMLPHLWAAGVFRREWPGAVG